ncbi:MAG: hypothetical protein ABSC63_11745 [Candidatus Binataceae bacterium]|jgi:hypothetical protein
MANRLRALASKEYPRDADAVIGVNESDNDAGTATTVSGEAVEVVNHATVACVLRAMPPVVDAVARTAAGGMLGTLVGGLGTGTPQGAESGGYLGAAAAGTAALMTHRQNEMQQDQKVRDALVEQRQTITSLQDARARLHECMEEELPLARCDRGVEPASNQGATVDKSDEPDWNASRFDLEKQSQMQQDYIAKLRGQIDDLKQQMQSK